MGLQTGEHGVKATLKSEFSAAFKNFKTLESIPETLGVDRSSCLCILDGNVMLNAVPTSIRSFEGVLELFTSQIISAFRASNNVVIVFDEAECMTKAKKLEQESRDMQRIKTVPCVSEDLVLGPKTDDYDEAELLKADIHYLMSHRQARPRYFDHICHSSIHKIASDLEDAETQLPNLTLTFDGIDSRGIGRPQGAKRTPGILSTSQEMASVLLQRLEPIGEGDLKMGDVSRRVGESVFFQPTALATVCPLTLHLLVTIDTDSLLIELLNEVKNDDTKDNTNRLVAPTKILVFNEPSRRCKGEVIPATKLCLDVGVLKSLVGSYLLGTSHCDRTAAMRLRLRRAVCVFCLSLLSCKSDFCKVDGLRADLLLPEIRKFVQEQQKQEQKQERCLSRISSSDGGGNGGEYGEYATGRFACFDHCATTADVFVVKNCVWVLEALIGNYALSLEHNGRLKKSYHAASNVNRKDLYKAAWVLCYWLGNEFHNLDEFGF
jgi:hypothetical protein